MSSFALLCKSPQIKLVQLLHGDDTSTLTQFGNANNKAQFANRLDEGEQDEIQPEQNGITVGRKSVV